MAFKLPKLQDLIVGFIAAFFAVQIVSVIISQIFPDIPVIKGGQAILLMLLAISIITLFIIGTKLENLKKKETLIFIVILFGLVGLAYVYLPKTFPNLFSIAPELSQAIENTLGSIINNFRVK